MVASKKPAASLSVPTKAQKKARLSVPTKAQKKQAALELALNNIGRFIESLGPLTSDQAEYQDLAVVSIAEAVAK